MVLFSTRCNYKNFGSDFTNNERLMSVQEVIQREIKLVLVTRIQVISASFQRLSGIKNTFGMQINILKKSIRCIGRVLY